MKISQYTLAVFICFISITANTMPLCDQHCWRQRQYELDRAQQNAAEEHYRQDRLIEEKRYQDILKLEHENKRLQLLSDAKKRCDAENMNHVSLEERNFCQTIKGYYAYGLPVPDAMLGLFK